LNPVVDYFIGDYAYPLYHCNIHDDDDFERVLGNDPNKEPRISNSSLDIDRADLDT